METGEETTFVSARVVATVDSAVIAALRDVVGTSQRGRAELDALVTTFLSDAHRRAEQLVRAVRARNLHEIEQLSHSLAGSSSSLGAVTVADRCSVIQQRALDGDMKELARDVAHLLRELAASELIYREEFGLPGPVDRSCQP